MALSHSDLVALAKTAGFGDNSVTAAAIAMAESGGNPKAHNAVPPDNSYGLWQINMLGSMGPARRKQYKLNSNEDLYDPATNARVAYGIYQGSGFKAWTTYTRGTYKKFLTGGESGGETTPTTLPASTTPTGGTGIVGAVNAFGDTLFKTGANIGGLIIAIALLVLGVVLLARNQVASVLPTGKAAKIAKGVLKS